MAGLLSGLAGLGLESLENLDIYEEPQSEDGEKRDSNVVPKVEEKDLIYNKNFECPVCGKNAVNKIMKTGKAKMLGTDMDLRPKYEGIDAAKYDVQLCTSCGYAALGRYFPNISSGQAKLIRENISNKVQLHPGTGEIYSYEEVLERYKLCLAVAVVKRARTSEKAYICLKSAWLLRGYAEYLNEQENTDAALVDAIAKEEEEYLLNAYNGFVEAAKTETYPMCGMDEMTVDYMLAVLAMKFKKYDVATKMTAKVLTSPSASARTKDKARELKDQILAEIKRK